MRVAAVAAVFVLGVAVGRTLEWGERSGGGPPGEASTSTPTSLAGAMAEVRRLGTQYDAALRNLERLAGQEGAPVASVSQQRLAVLDMLVEASRTALAAEPADPVLNSYLFAALEQREAVLREMGVPAGAASDVLWR